jgi:hypothetical protein
MQPRMDCSRPPPSNCVRRGDGVRLERFESTRKSAFGPIDMLRVFAKAALIFVASHIAFVVAVTMLFAVG